MWGILGPDQIPSLDNPVWLQADRQGTPSYLGESDRVIGFRAGQNVYAVPHNVLWHHEIVNLDLGVIQLAITYCPLTGSSLIFDRAQIGGAELGVSGTLFMNNLMMFDRGAPTRSLWPQMMGEARCGPLRGTGLDRYPFVEMEWEAWRQLHPDTRVLAGAEQQGFDPLEYDYWQYPYGAYEDFEAFFTLLMPPLDRRRFSKERVVGLPPSGQDPGIAFPFEALKEREGNLQAIGFTYRDESAVVLWSDQALGGAVFRPRTEDGTNLTLAPGFSGFRDAETGSVWTLDGRAVAGPLTGSTLVAIERAYTAFWGAWAAFHPETRLWGE